MATDTIVVTDRKAAWEDAGADIGEAKTAEQMIDAAGLNWTVDLKPVYYKTSEKSDVLHAIPGRSAVVRNDDKSALAVVGSDYVPFQNSEVFTFGDNLTDGGAKWGPTAGSLRGGKWIWAMMTFDKGLKIGGVDAYQRLLLLSTSHDGSKGIGAANVFNRVVCENTFNLALATASHVWTVRHTKTAEGKLLMAREALELSFEGAKEFQIEMEKLLKAKLLVKGKEFDTFLDTLLKGKFKDKTLETVKADITALASGGNLENVKDTRYGALQAVGEYFEHDEARNRTPEGKMTSTMMGQARSVRNRAFALLAA